MFKLQNSKNKYFFFLKVFVIIYFESVHFISMYIYLYKVKQYLEIKLQISFEQILVNQFLHLVDIATCVKCKIHKEQKMKACLKCLQ